MSADLMTADSALRVAQSPTVNRILRDLRERARHVVGGTPADAESRVASELLSAFLGMFAEGGVNLHDLDQAIGARPGTVRMRLIRHGYLPGGERYGMTPYGTPSKSRRGTRLSIAGQRFGRLTAIRATAESGPGGVLWVFRCDCGAFVRKPGGQVRAGRVKSCGCLPSGRRDLRRSGSTGRFLPMSDHQFRDETSLNGETG